MVLQGRVDVLVGKEHLRPHTTRHGSGADVRTGRLTGANRTQLTRMTRMVFEERHLVHEQRLAQGAGTLPQHVVRTSKASEG